MSLNRIEATTRSLLAGGALFMALNGEAKAADPAVVLSKPNDQKIDAPRYGNDELRIPENPTGQLIIGIEEALRQAEARRNSNSRAARNLRPSYSGEIAIPEANSPLQVDDEVTLTSMTVEGHQSGQKAGKETTTNRVASFAGQFDNSNNELEKEKLVSDEKGQLEVAEKIYPNDKEAQKNALSWMRVNRGTYYLTPYNAPTLGSTKNVVGMNQSGKTLVVYTQEVKSGNDCNVGHKIQQEVRVFMLQGLDGSGVTEVREEKVAPVIVNC